MTTYRIHEVFETFQGEGVHMGLPAFFIRTHGCPVHCPWCDSAGTWHKDWVPKGVQRMSAEQLVKLVLEAGRDRVVITGGEPTVQDLEELTMVLDSEGINIHLETSGGFPINGVIDWITLSPKKWKLPLAENVRQADEFKIIVETPEDIEDYLLMIRNLGGKTWEDGSVSRKPPIWLHPEWSHRGDAVVLNAISAAVKQGDGTLRAGWQIHKQYQVDQLDPRSRPLVPLGGDEKKGF